MFSAKVNVVAILGIIALIAAGFLAFGFATTPAVAQKDEAAKPSDVAKSGEAGGNRVNEQLARLQLEQTQRELAQMYSDLRKTRAELAFWEAREDKMVKMTIPDSAIEERMNLDPAVAKLLNRINELRHSIAEVESVTAPGKSDAIVKDIRDQITTTEKILGTLRPMLRAQITQQLREKAYDEFKGRIVQFKEQIEFWEGFEKNLKADVQRLSAQVKGGTSGGSADARLTALEKEVRELKDALAELKKKN
jgi:hypothetical protein